MRDIKTYINESISINESTLINEAMTGKTKTSILEIAKDLEEYLSQIIPSLNNKWKKWFKTGFTSSDLNEIYNNCSDVSLVEWRGRQTRSDWESGTFDRYQSYYKQNTQDTIKELNKEYNERDRYKMIFSTCCEYLEGCGYDDPAVEWKKRDFVCTATAMEFVINKLK